MIESDGVFALSISCSILSNSLFGFIIYETGSDSEVSAVSVVLFLFLIPLVLLQMKLFAEPALGPTSPTEMWRPSDSDNREGKEDPLASYIHYQR